MATVPLCKCHLMWSETSKFCIISQNILHRFLPWKLGDWRTCES